MADRFQKLFSLENNLYIENAPIIISAAALLKDTKSGNIVVQIKFKSVSNKNIKGVKISLSAYDVSGKEINGVDDYQYLDLNIPNGQSFGSSKAIVMPETTTRSFNIKSLTVIFADSSIWENVSPDFVVIPNAKTLNCELENEELIKQYQIATTNKANYIPNTFLNLWICCCGEVNSEEYCTNCGTNKNNAFSKYNITDLTEAMNLRLEKEKEESFAAYMKLAKALSLKRKACFKELESKVMEHCKDLMLENARFMISCMEKKPSSNGIDDIEFLVSMNPGQDFSSLSASASGGELSRLMLALKVVFQASNGIETIIFDEIDTGVSGKVALAMGAKMKALSKNYQVLCITHLASVAVYANTHYLVNKKASASETITSVQELDQDKTIQELAVMTSGEASQKAKESMQDLWVKIHG